MPGLSDAQGFFFLRVKNVLKTSHFINGMGHSLHKKISQSDFLPLYELLFSRSPFASPFILHSQYLEQNDTPSSSNFPHFLLFGCVFSWSSSIKSTSPSTLTPEDKDIIQSIQD